MPDNAMFKVRGMGVADRVSTSTLLQSYFSFSFCATPNRCSSSMMTRPRSLEFHVLADQAVGADDHIHSPRAQLADNFVLLLRRAEAGEQLHVDREALHPAQ